MKPTLASLFSLSVVHCLQLSVSAALQTDGSATHWLQPYGAGSCSRSLTTQDCPLFNPASDLVTPNTLRTLLTATECINLYTFEIKTDDTFGKCRYRFTPKGGDVYFKQLISSGSPAEYDLFYSQEPSLYMWLDICFRPTPGGGCAQRYFDLLARADRIDKDQVAVLTGLPFDKISADLGKVMGKGFGDPVVRFNWIGPECPL